MWALYCLVQFYNLTHERLQPIRPLAKFISFKAIVFATWWQGVWIVIICYFGVLPKEEKIQNGIQDFLICIEMAIAAVAHVYIFSPEPYHYLPVFECGNIANVETKTKLKMEEDLERGPAVVEQTETRLKAPGTSFTESVQDVVLGGGEHGEDNAGITMQGISLVIPLGSNTTCNEKGEDNADDATIEFLLSQFNGKDITELIATGREKFASVPSGGAAVAAASSYGWVTSAAAAATAEAEKEEKEVDKEILVFAEGETRANREKTMRQDGHRRWLASSRSAAAAQFPLGVSLTSS